VAPSPSRARQNTRARKALEARGRRFACIASDGTAP
jgi:hypothetical protein